MNAQRLTCHRCGSDRLELVEITEELHSWSDGLMLADGEIQPLGEADHAPGHIQTAKSWIKCHGCGHGWHPRRRIGEPFEERAA